jgi:hypothetical protein
VKEAVKDLKHQFFNGNYPASIVFWVDPSVAGGIPLSAVTSVIFFFLFENATKTISGSILTCSYHLTNSF